MTNAESAQIEHTLVSTVSYAERFLSPRAIANPQDFSIAGNDLTAIKTKYKELEELRKSMTKPLDESKKRIMDLFRKPLEVLETAEKAIKFALLSYSEREAKAEAERKAQAETSGDMELYIEVAPKAEGVSTREIWKFEIVDEKLIPREWLTPDLNKIGQAARGAKDAISIPGVRIYSEKILSAKSY